MHRHVRTLIVTVALFAIGLAATPAARAGVATGALATTIRIVDSCDVRTRLPGEQVPAPAAMARVPHTHSTRNVGIPAPRITTTVVPVPPAAKGSQSSSKSGVTIKIVAIYF